MFSKTSFKLRATGNNAFMFLLLLVSDTFAYKVDIPMCV